MRKFHALFAGSGGLYDAIVPTSTQESALRAAKNKIRDHLLRGIEAASMDILGLPQKVSPRFKTQGSWAYRACVQPAQPTQEMDWDYGVYLPVDAWEDAATPRVAASAYFDLVERLLKELCEQEGWHPGKNKPRCIRVHVGQGAHIDVALYAAPKEKFLQVNDRHVEYADMQKAMDGALNRQLLAEAYEFEPEQDWDDFDDFMVATRDGTWERSDAEAIARWFRDQADTQGDQLRRCWRYLKAWRDMQWETNGPSSVLLMLAATRHFAKWPARDDRTLADVAYAIAEAVLHDYHEEGIDADHNFNRMDPKGRLDAHQRLTQLATTLRQAMTEPGLDKLAVLAALRGHFGARLPHREADIVDDHPADRIRATPAREVIAPKVNSSYAG
ncbi:hypothetical protein EKH79_03535 [Dyella dinghuensis]|uniref:Cyclic GMP-AMP synthase n=1 Tax=Dyella dinghuensis TaxID=1920169 RepID=A0A3S0PD37_9GAMM|nr:hypothetical protein [Dyella dinghuensis]RUL65796.1 hypothetical protein EKH79_03535 [Dyella dinghuensis]